jgi:DNA repair exonuclease SbcCD nuclease subunit
MIFLGDPHIDSKLGSIRVIELINEKIDKLIAVINEEDKVVFLGDYFNPSNPENEYRELLSNIIIKITIPKIFIIGNHDKDKRGFHCLNGIKSFIEQNNGIVVEDYLEQGDYCYISYTLDFQHIRDIISKTKCKYIVGHFAFDYELNNRELKEVEYDIAFKDKIFLLGHIHKHQIKGNVNYIGSLAPTKLDEIGYDYKILSIDNGGNFNWRSIKYNFRVIKTLEELKGIEDKSRVIFQGDVDTLEERNKIMELLGGQNLLNVKIEVKNKQIDIGNMDIKTMVQEYLKILGKEGLYDKVIGLIEGKNINEMY